jgi:hypothetical protein
MPAISLLALERISTGSLTKHFFNRLLSETARKVLGHPLAGHRPKVGRERVRVRAAA